MLSVVKNIAEMIGLLNAVYIANILRIEVKDYKNNKPSIFNDYLGETYEHDYSKYTHASDK